MPEAVIVATARTPIGRANKGSLVDCRPDDLSALIIDAVLDKVPQLDPALVEDVIWGCGQPAGEAGHQHRPRRRHPRRRRRARRDRQPLLLVVAADDPHGRARDQGRRGRRVRLRRRRDRQPLPVRRGRHRSARTTKFGEAHARTKARDRGRPAARGRRPPVSPTSTSRWARPPRTCVEAERRRRARRWTSSRRALAAARASPPRRTASSSARSRRSRRPTAPSCRKDDGPRAGTTVEKLATLKPVFRPDGTVTAGNACPLNDGAAAVVVMSDTKAERARHHAARAHRRQRRERARTPRSWASARSRRAARR